MPSIIMHGLPLTWRKNGGGAKFGKPLFKKLASWDVGDQSVNARLLYVTLGSPPFRVEVYASYERLTAHK